MKQKIPLLFLISAILCFSLPGFSGGFELVDKKDIELELTVRFACLGSFTLPGNTIDTAVSSARIALRGELYKNLDFKLSCDTEAAGDQFSPDYLFLLEDMYMQYEFHDYFEISAGRFKTPFGEEMFYSLGERPYIQRTHTSRDIPPGRDLGVMVSGKKIAGLFGYDLGIFSGNSPGLPEDVEEIYLLAGKVSARYKGLEFLDIKAGYNAYYHHYIDSVAQHQLAQGMFLKAVLSLTRIGDISILTEYQERVKLRNVINQNMDWTRGFFIATSWRYGCIEPLILLEWYDGSLLYFNNDDSLFSMSTGLAGYFLQDDLVRLKLLYDLEYPYDSGVVLHRISVMLQMEL